MQTFDHIYPGNLDHRQWQLVALAVTVIVILASGMSLLMYPAVFAHPVVLSASTLRQAFFGFCVLSTLLVSYLVDRQIVISNLRQQTVEDKKRIIDIRHEASADLLGTLPGWEHFRDRLAMEFRRASNAQQPLTLLTIDLKPSRELAETAEVPTACADAVKALSRKLRPTDSIYVFALGMFGIVLPGINVENAHQIVDRLVEGLRDPSGGCTRFAFDVQMFNYSGHAATARGMEEAVRALIRSREARASKAETMTSSPQTP
jgi:GGDEF domain-containing protein